MRNITSLIVPLAVSISACGSGAGSGAPQPSTTTAAFTPPALAEGYTRFTAMTVSDVQPGQDLTRCQYVMAPMDHDMDVLDIMGAQSKAGHHAVMFSYVPTADQEVGQEIQCMMGSTEFTAGTPGETGGGLSGGGFLGAVSPAGGRVASLPAGVAFRLKQGNGIMLNLHYINLGEKPVDGDAYIDLKLAEPDPNRLIAALFLNLNIGFKLPPSVETESTADCVAQSDVKVIMMSNHMHEWGANATTQVTRVDTGTVEVLRDDPTWDHDMVNNPTFATWSAESPFMVHTGDTLRTRCTWENTSADTLEFPREMCISAGFALASSDSPTAPVCFNGNWVASGL